MPRGFVFVDVPRPRAWYEWWRHPDPSAQALVVFTGSNTSPTGGFEQFCRQWFGTNLAAEAVELRDPMYSVGINHPPIKAHKGFAEYNEYGRFSREWHAV